MRFAGSWLLAVSTLALAACHPARPVERAAASRPAVAKAALSVSTPAAQGPATPVALGGADAGAARPSTAAGDKVAPGPLARRRAAEPAGWARHARTQARAAGRSEARREGSSAEYAACMSAADGFTVVTANCYSAELARQGARLNRAYEAALAADSGAERESLAQEQRAWIMLRDSRCQDEAAGGGSDLLREGRCRLDLTIQRAVQLERRAG
jgi:uncharacterized protein YecT (DUF1311 family)